MAGYRRDVPVLISIFQYIPERRKAYHLNGDDGSCDAMVGVVRTFVSENQQNNIRLVENEENLGYVRNFNKAISLISGDYIFLADQEMNGTRTKSNIPYR